MRRIVDRALPLGRGPVFYVVEEKGRPLTVCRDAPGIRGAGRPRCGKGALSGGDSR